MFSSLPIILETGINVFKFNSQVVSIKKPSEKSTIYKCVEKYTPYHFLRTHSLMGIQNLEIMIYFQNFLRKAIADREGMIFLFWIF